MRKVKVFEKEDVMEVPGTCGHAITYLKAQDSVLCPVCNIPQAFFEVKAEKLEAI